MTGAGRAPQRLIAVVGMHRSGTSCLTGSLQRAGLVLGEVHEWNRYNLKGNRENQAIVDLNDAVLAASGGSWDAPPTRVHWRAAHKARAREILASLADAPVAGFKDPRTLLVIDGWLEVYPAMEFVGVFRHPAAVAASLANRSEMARDVAYGLWEAYNKRLLALRRGRGFPLVDFDIDAEGYRATVEQLAGELGLDATAVAEEPFFEEGLRKAHGSDRLPLSLRWLHGRLRRGARATIRP
ncbi:hypothetical protein [Pseudohaliea sp.]|uniref:hypothetical protein n=1 Tax=Pseudohaliea sp. TaxID=2740289 RepID=UPI0032F0040B